jgi:hypothetical protein
MTGLVADGLAGRKLASGWLTWYFRVARRAGCSLRSVRRSAGSATPTRSRTRSHPSTRSRGVRGVNRSWGTRPRSTRYAAARFLRIPCRHRLHRSTKFTSVGTRPHCPRRGRRSAWRHSRLLGCESCRFLISGAHRLSDSWCSRRCPLIQRQFARCSMLIRSSWSLPGELATGARSPSASGPCCRSESSRAGWNRCRMRLRETSAPASLGSMA